MKKKTKNTFDLQTYEVGKNKERVQKGRNKESSEFEDEVKIRRESLKQSKEEG